MALTSRYAALAFRLAAIGLILTGLIRLTGVFSGETSWVMLVFYTTQSNLLCLGWMVFLAAVTLRDLRRHGPRGVCQPWPRLAAMVMMAITVTMAIYLVVLAPATFRQGGEGYVPFTLTDDLIHIITPCLLIADWFLFSPKGRLRLFDPVLWAIPPYIYLLFVFIWAVAGLTFGSGRRYPYPFLDVQAHGAGGVILQVAVLTVTLVAFGYIYVVADKLLARAARRGAA
ncbi:MAG: Pr6Pr family membrane protein [Bifidobacteriaceae bacterium]|nr:Pr6Pr family membrane protein [Bifidobacteriaceae bacterium]